MPRASESIASVVLNLTEPCVGGWGIAKALIQRKSMIAKQFVDIALTGASYNELVCGPEWLLARRSSAIRSCQLGIE